MSKKPNNKKSAELENDVAAVKIDYKNIPTEWDLESLFGYKSYKDPQIKKDVNKGIKEIKAFAKKWSKRTDWLEDPKVLSSALSEYFDEASSTKPLYYLGLLASKETTNSELQAIDSSLSEQVSIAAEAVMFFSLKLGKVPAKTQKKFLKSKDLEEHHFWLKELFEEAKHDLTEAEERIVSRYSRPKGGLWIETLQKALNKKTVSYRGKEIPHTTAAAMVSLEKNRKMRQILNKKLYEEYESVSDIAEGAYNAVLLNKKISNDLRGYKKVYSATVQAYQNTEREVEGLVKVVSDNYKISHDYYKFKKQVLDYDELTYADRNIEIGNIKKQLSYPKTLRILAEVLERFDTGCADAFKEMLTSGQYDAFPAVGKRGGAFQAGQAGQPTMVFLNHVDGFNALQTLAHETGHALHTYHTQKHQPIQYQNYPISTAEVASTFFEQVLFYDQLPHFSDREQFVLLMTKMNDAVNTIQRQIAFFQIETEMHELIKTNGHLSAQELKDVMLKHVRNYLGKGVFVDDYIGNLVNVMAQAHFASPFYVYAYAYGELISKALYQIYEADNDKGRSAVIKFMSAGSSATPKDIFKASGITVGPKLWDTGLEQMRHDLLHLKRLHRKIKAKK